ncbi:sp110 nuclear body protein [Suncus etruscus]|uniref:sp110 nuclear body protein n=1 Tax=Suncus etruscus TaxID=109475 RepID=UPI002110962E|nr:sp110 nuclear body protein [Suncus etruscus]
MFTQSRALEVYLFQHFKKQKVDIAYAISKPFPFFEGLRDSSLITEKVYGESLEAFWNHSPISVVVYKILTMLEKTFSLMVLQNLFSYINLQEYPKLQHSYQSFKKALTEYGDGCRTDPNLFEVPTSLADGPSSLQIQTLVPKKIRTHTCLRADLEESCSLAGPSMELPRSIQKQRFSPVSSENLSSLIIVNEDVQEIPSVAPGPVPDDTSEADDLIEIQEAPQTPPKTPKKAKKRKRSVWSTPKKRKSKKCPLKAGTATPGHEIQEQQLQVEDSAAPRMVDTPRDVTNMTRSQLRKTKCAQALTPEEKKSSLSSPCRTSKRKDVPGNRIQKQQLQVRNKATPKMDDTPGDVKIMTRAQRAKTKYAQASTQEETPTRRRLRRRLKHERVRGREQAKVDSRSHLLAHVGSLCHESKDGFQKRVQKTTPPEITRDEHEDFHLPVLPVTCGKARGLLYKEKMKKGSTVKCIQNEQGRWLTPQEFEGEGQRAKSKKWKRSLSCRGKTLEYLLKEPDLRECEVCSKQGPVILCDACDRAFHGHCHIPQVEADRRPWSCTFCRMKEISGSQQCLQGSHALDRRMRPEEQLKCEFLLLKTYCHPQSVFFVNIPHNIEDYGEPFREAMWLNLVKERLAEHSYTVSWFVRDVRLIFQNHREFYKTSDFSYVGLDLEAEFEKNLKELLALCCTQENRFWIPDTGLE